MEQDGENPNQKSDVNTQSQQLYNKSVELEKELKLLLKKKNLFDKHVVAIRNSLKDTYEKLLFLNFDFAASQDIEHTLWKTVFYKLIEEYRKRIRQHVTVLGKTDSGTTVSKEKEDLQRLCDSFRNFLLSATKFYKELIKKFQKAFNLKLDGTEYDGVTPVHKSYLSCHRCHIFLGDLARYHKDLHNHSNHKDWTTASAYYREALLLIPDNGNPHNQLAVLATYVDDEFVAVYHYFLSLACTHPFPTAKDNLSVLFDKNRARLEGNEPKVSQDPQKREFKKFVTKFIRLHGILYTNTSLEKFDELEIETLRQFDRLMSKEQINDDFLFMLFVINIFSIHNSSIDGKAQVSFEEASRKAILFKYANSLGLHFFAHTLKFAAQSQLRYILSIGVYVEYLKILNQLKNPDERDQQTWSNIWKDYAKLLTLIGPIDTRTPVSKMPTLLEEIELKGFTPLLSVYRMLPYMKDVPPEQTLLKRVCKIKEFGAFVIQELPKTPLFYDAENEVWSDQPVKVRPAPKERTPVSPVDTGNMEVVPPRRSSVPVDSLNEEVPEEKFSEKIGLEELLEDNLEDEVILYPGENAHRSVDEHDSHKAVGSERIERSSSSDKHGEPTSPRAMHQGFGLFPQSNVSSSSFFSYNSLFPQNAQTNGNSFFGDPVYTTPNSNPTSPNGNYPQTPVQNPSYPFPPSSNFNNNANMNLRKESFGSFWSPGASNSFFAPQQGEKTNNPYVSPPSNPFANQQHNVKTSQQVQSNIWMNGSDAQQAQPLSVNNFGNQNGQTANQNFQYNAAPLPFPFPGVNAQPPFKTKNPFIS